jgi:hypothetical protein
MSIYNLVKKSWLIDTITNGTFDLYLTDLTTFPEVYDSTIDNTPTSEAYINLTNIITNIYEPCCQHFKTAIKILPSYRNYETTSYLGLDTDSDHTFGLAIDIEIESLERGVKNIELFNYIKDNLSYDKLIMQDNNIIHISYKTNDTNEYKVYKTNSFGNLEKI